MQDEEFLRAKREEIRRLYEVEDPWRFGTNVYEKIRHAALAELVMEGAPRRVLDLGCGEGHFLGALLRRAPYIKAVGVELIPEAAARCRKRLSPYNAIIHTADALDFLSPKTVRAHGDFNAVVCGDVLYYIPPRLLAKVVVPGVALLNPKGRLIVSSAGLHDDKKWTVDSFLGRFRLAYQMHLEPIIDPPPCTWMISLLTPERSS